MKSVLEKALNKRKIYLDYEDLEQITNDIIAENKENYNIGLFTERNKFNEKEKAFSDEWQKENLIPCISVNISCISCFLLISLDSKSISLSIAQSKCGYFLFASISYSYSSFLTERF